MLNTFRSNIERYYEPNRFKLRVVPPIGRLDPTVQTDNALPTFRTQVTEWRPAEFLCDSANLPGVGILTEEIITQVLPRKIAYTSKFDNFECSFFVAGAVGHSNQTFREFQRWINFIHNHDNDETSIGYYDNYIGELRLSLFQRSDTAPAHTVVMTEAYPVIVSPVPLNWASTDEIMRLSVTFAYHRWYVVEEDQPLLPSESIDGLFRAIPGAAATVRRRFFGLF